MTISNNTQMLEYIADQIAKYEGIYVPIKASFPERTLIKSLNVYKLHPNPDDEFSFPDIGPSFRIIEEYATKFRRQGNMIELKLGDDPIMVQKIYPDGYMILNGHHRWAAAIRNGIKKVPVSVVNITGETDIQKMIEASNHDKRVTLDLDEVVFCNDGDAAEKPLHFPSNRIFKEKIRLGIPSLLHNLGVRGYDVWVYTSQYYSQEYISAYFRRYSVKLDGVITGTGRKNRNAKEARQKIENMFAAKYTETLHIDNNSVLRTNRGSGEFDEFEIKDTGEGWSKEVLSIVKGLGDEQ